MKYLSLDTVAKAYHKNATCTSNKFWGLMGILSSIKRNITPGISYKFDPTVTAEFLEELFCLGEKKSFSSLRSSYYAMFSINWIRKTQDLMCEYTPNFYDVAVWYFRKYAFSQIPTKEDLINKFSSKTGLSLNDIERLFTFEDRFIDFADYLYNERELLLAIANRYTNPHHYSSLSAEGGFIKAHPGELSRAPFIQTIYAAQRAPECLLLTQFDVLTSYSLKPCN